MCALKDGEVYSLIEKSKKGDRLAQSIIVENNLRLVWSVVKRFQNRGYELDDLFQIGCIGLIKAIRKFETSYGVKFSTYAVPMIIGEIKRFIRDDGIIKVSRSLKEIYLKAKTIKEIMTGEMGKEPCISEIADRMGISCEELVMAMESNIAPESLYASFGEDESSGNLLIDRISTMKNDTNEIDIIDKIALKQVLDSLDPEEKRIINLRYFKEKTQVQIAKLIGISQVQVSRIERRILKNLRNKIKIN